MTKNELNTFRKVLANRQNELGNETSNREALAIETSPDEMDRIQHANDRDYAMNSMERNSNQLREVKMALRRMEEGMFGVCVGCGKDMNAKRLAAIPWASFCVVCQEAEDRTRKALPDEIDTTFAIAA
jgi:DnaK suppressor protein